MNAARIIWVVSGHVAALNIADHGRTLTSRPWRSVKPCGLFIHALAQTTKNAESTPATKIGTPAIRCARGESRSQPYR
jgi:hypothetical protein